MDADKKDNNLIDQSVRHEAALYFADGDNRQAINLLIKRINDTNGYCDAKNWLMLLDIYQVIDQRGAYEKLAVFFSNRFNFSPPAWLELDKKNKKEQGYWRNALIIEGSPLGVLDQKTRDFIRASKEEGSSRLDLSRMQLTDEDSDGGSDTLKKELEKLFSIMKRLRKINKPTLLMGEGELKTILGEKIKNQNGKYEDEKIYWELLFEITQWRGEEKQYNTLFDEFSEKFDYCPIGYEPEQAIALTPDEKHLDEGEFSLIDMVDDAEKTMKHLQQMWEDNKKVEISLNEIKKISSNFARQLAEFLQASLELGFSQNQVGGELAKAKQNEVIFTDTPETIVALFEITGVAAYATIQYQHVKLRNLNFKNPN